MKNFICLCFVLCFMDQSLCGDSTSIIVEPGKKVNLPCRAGRNSKVSAVSLTRGDLEPKYLLVYRDDRIDEDLQNPQYLGRTKLQSLNATDGKINLTLSNVIEKDSGVYECRVKTEIKSNTRRKRAALESTITIIQLDVAPPAPQGHGHIGLILGVVVFAVFAVFAVIVWKKRTVSPPQDESIETLHA